MITALISALCLPCIRHFSLLGSMLQIQEEEVLRALTPQGCRDNQGSLQASQLLGQGSRQQSRPNPLLVPLAIPPSSFPSLIGGLSRVRGGAGGKEEEGRLPKWNRSQWCSRASALQAWPTPT